MTDQPRDEPNRYARLDPVAQALVDDHDQIALAELLVKAHDDLERAALVHNGRPGTRWLHVTFTSPDATTANTSALAIADHLRAEFDGVSMRITSNAVEASPSCSPNNPETEPNNSAATEATDTETTARVFAALHRSAEETVTRVIDLYEQWVKAGAPPLGVSMSRWWDARLVELRGAIHAPAEQPGRTTANNPPGSTREQLPDHLLALIRDRLPDYTSTACQTADTLGCAACYPGSGVPRPQYDEIREHAERLHERCRINHKFTGQLCACGCHPEEQQPYPPIGLTNQENQS